MKSRFNNTDAAPGADQAMLGLEQYLHECGLEESLIHSIQTKHEMKQGETMEFTRREALISALLPLVYAAAGRAEAQQPQTAPSTSVFEHDLPDITMDGWQVNVSTITMAPQSVSSAHRHPGFVLVYVLDGQIVTKISGQEQRTYSAGEMFYEQPGSTHEVSRNASATKPAKFLAMIFAKKGAQLVTPA